MWIEICSENEKDWDETFHLLAESFKESTPFLMEGRSEEDVIRFNYEYFRYIYEFPSFWRLSSVHLVARPVKPEGCVIPLVDESGSLYFKERPLVNQFLVFSQKSSGAGRGQEALNATCSEPTSSMALFWRGISFLKFAFSSATKNNADLEGMGLYMINCNFVIFPCLNSIKKILSNFPQTEMSDGRGGLICAKERNKDGTISIVYANIFVHRMESSLGDRSAMDGIDSKTTNRHIE